MDTMTEMQARIEQLRAKPADRITEQDALALVDSAMHHYIFNDRNVNIDDWFESEGRALLDKLNADREPAVSVPDVDWLAETIRRVDGDHKLGAGALAEKIISAMLSASPADSEGE